MSSSDALLLLVVVTMTIFVCIFAVAYLVINYIALYKVFIKMGEHGWKSLVPFYNSYILFQHAFGNGIWFLITFVPGVGIIATMLVNILICLRFNRNEALMIVASMLGFGYIIVGFDHSVYTGDKQL